MKIVYEELLKKEDFQKHEKSVAPVRKKADRTLIKIYRPISLLPIFGKIFNRIIYNSLSNHFLSIRTIKVIHKVNTALGDNPVIDVRGVFLDTSKAFDKICIIVSFLN